MAKENKIGVCKLCLKEQKLCQSHIIPEFMYKPLYDKPTHKYHVLSNVAESKNRQLQKGVWEYLLCAGCESHIQEFEQYTRNLLFDDNKPFEGEKYQNHFILYNIDYVKFKLFQLSVLWRAGICTRREFKHVDLAPRHESKLRQMILDRDPGKKFEYGSMLCALIDEGKWVQGFMELPINFKIDSHRFFYFIFGGLVWVFIVSSHMNQFDSSKISLDENGTLIVIKKEITQFKHIQDFARELYTQGKFK